MPDSEIIATTTPIAQHSDIRSRTPRSSHQTLKHTAPTPCLEETHFSNSGRAKKTTGPVEVLEEPRNVLKPDGNCNSTLISNSSVSHYQENTVPEDDGFEMPAYQKKRARTEFRKAAVSNAINEVEAAKAMDPSDEGSWKRLNDAQAVLAQARKEDNRRLAMQQKAAEAARPRHKSIVIGKYGHRSLYEAQPKTKNHGVRFSDQIPGAIFYHEEVRRLAGHPSIKPGDPGTFQDHRGIWHFAKGRFLVSYSRQHAKINEVEILTFGNTGVAKVPEEELCEYINLKPKGVVNYKPQVLGAPVLEVQTKIGRRFVDRDTMLVRVSCPHTRDLDCDELEKVGSITNESLRILIASIQKFPGRNALTEGK
ncbi:uncharacterized protein MYCFIDRAFT_176625 [Pseudocercospora fijiensis CIRAD86]|uniref:Uncharacterized protein n=1 Tax=Pseudocercospora fijiensis (strain CIRAD86) TaxID=383855 RepID=M2YUD8_PSEFD|nr:uncharacterized protein MYCFIDRAFT_176625 [Pseudocercospora fijiensis CIRAD86]EME81340.1 hypothetical protein MYCFIDRAFT_176625 [Pseudocercospora fijiensis CIRAD86]